jgi:hypothetical protein
MLKTLEGGIRKIANFENEPVSKVINAFGEGSLLGARGNSGVILSMFFKGLAKGLVDLTNEDQIEMLGLFLTGFEKYKILCHFLYWVPPYRSKQAKDIMVKWDNNALISLEALRKPDSVPAIWQEYLASLSSILVSADAKDNGETLTFETMLEDIIDEELEKKDAKIDRDNIIQVVSLRGTGDYCLGAEDEDAEAAK